MYPGTEKRSGLLKGLSRESSILDFNDPWFTKCNVELAQFLFLNLKVPHREIAIETISKNAMAMAGKTLQNLLFHCSLLRVKF